MIRAYEEKDYALVIALWQEAFGDTEADIAACIRHFTPYLMLYTQDDALLGMFMLLPLRADGKKGDYIYALATAKCARGRGIATALLDFAKARVKGGTSDFLALVPAKPSLFEFYEKRGFTKGAYVSKKTFTQLHEAQAEITIQSISPEQMYAYRKAHFECIAEWDEKMLSAIDALYGGDRYYALKSKTGNGFCMAYISKNKLIVPEICLQNIPENDAICALQTYFSLNRIEAVLPDKNGEAFAMFYPAEASDMYFNIAIN